MNTINFQYFMSNYGELIIASVADCLCMCDWTNRRTREAIDKRIQNALQAQYLEKTSEIIEIAKEQILEYFAGERQNFDVRLLLVGTEFQKQVWNSLLKLPYGDTISYSLLAQSINKPKAVRAVATAVGANALSLLVPCHRIIGIKNELVGYAGGIDTKRKLLELEIKTKRNIHVAHSSSLPFPSKSI